MRCVLTLLTLLTLLTPLLACEPPTGADPDAPSPLPDRYTLSDEVGFPEGMAFHAGTRAFFMGSLEHGGITRVNPDGAESRVYTPADDGWSSLGMKFHPNGDDLLVCAVRWASTPDATSALWVIDAITHTQRAIPLMDPPSNCNDLVAVDDHVYLTDRESARIHRVDLATDEAEVWLTHDALAPGLIGNNGLVVTDDGVLIQGQYAPARLIRIPIDNPDAAETIPQHGDPIGSVPDGADGMVWFDGAIAIAANRRIAAARSDDSWSSAQITAAEAPDAVAALTVAEGRLYGLKGEVVPYVLGTEADLPFAIVALELP